MLKTILDLFSSAQSPAKNIAQQDDPTTVNVHGSISNESEALEVLDPSRKAELKIWQGVRREKQGRLDEAITLYHRALEIEPKSAEAHQILAEALKKQNQITQAAYHYAQAAQLDRDNTVSKKIAEKFQHTDDENLPELATDLNHQQGQAIKLQLSTPQNSDTQVQKSKIDSPQKPSLSNQQTVLQTEEQETNSDRQNNYSQSNNQLTVSSKQQNQGSFSLVTQAPTDKSTISQNPNHASSLTGQNNNEAIVLPTLQTTPLLCHLGNGKSEAARIYLKQALAYGETQQWEQAIQSCQTALNMEPNCAEAYKVWGNILQKTNHFAEAIGCYAQAVAIQPDMAEVYANLGDLYAKQQKWQEAVEFYQKSLIINPNYASVYRSLAEIWEEFGEEEKALDCLFQALELEPHTLNAEQYFQLAQELQEEGKIHRAIACYRYAVTLNPDFRDAYLQLAKLLEENGQCREAGIYYQEIIRIQDEQSNGIAKEINQKRITKLLDSSSKLHNQLNNSSVKQISCDRGFWQRPALYGKNPQEIRQSVVQQRHNSLSKTEEAIQKYLQQAQREPDSAVVQINLGSLYARKQNWQKAIAHYHQAIKLDPNSAIGYRNLAQVYRKIGESNQAAELLYQAYSIEPSNISGMEHWQLGQIFQQQNQLQKAIACYRRVIQYQPDFTEAYLSLGTILDSQDNGKGAIACFKQVIKLQPTNSEALHKLGDALAKQEKWEPAIIAYQRAIGFNPDFSLSHYKLGVAWLKLKNWKAAAASFRTAIALNPDFSWSYDKLGDALVQLGRWSEAVDAYNRSQELQQNKKKDSLSSSVTE